MAARGPWVCGGPTAISKVTHPHPGMQMDTSNIYEYYFLRRCYWPSFSLGAIIAIVDDPLTFVTELSLRFGDKFAFLISQMSKGDFVL